MGQPNQGVTADGEVMVDMVSTSLEDYSLSFDPAEGMTRQEFRDECDINVLMATYETSGAIPRYNLGTPAFLDVSDVPDLPRAIAIMQQAETAFMTLPASIRREFENDAVAFVEFASDPGNVEQMRKWGLAPPAEAVSGTGKPGPDAGNGSVSNPPTGESSNSSQ